MQCTYGLIVTGALEISRRWWSYTTCHEMDFKSGNHRQYIVSKWSSTDNPTQSVVLATMRSKCNYYRWRTQQYKPTAWRRSSDQNFTSKIKQNWLQCFDTAGWVIWPV